MITIKDDPLVNFRKMDNPKYFERLNHFAQ